MKQEKERELIPISVPFENAQALFEKGDIAEHYQKVRKSEVVEKYYRDMMDEVKKACNSKLAKEILEDPEVEANNETLLIVTIINKALANLVKAGKGDIKVAIISTITEESLKEAIDKLKDNTCETINIFAESMIGEAMIGLALTFFDD